MWVKKRPRRGIVLFAAAVTGGITGANYMWSIFNLPLVSHFGATSHQITLAYSLFSLSVCIFGMISGPLQRKIRPQFIVLIAGICFGLGWLLTGYADNLVELYLSFGLLAGAGGGFIYNTAVTTAVRWFPDKKGLANGVCVGFLGLAPLLFAPMGNFFMERFDVFFSFRLCGIIFIVAYAIFAWMLQAPEDGWVPDGWHGSATVETDGLTTKQMLSTPLFWLLLCLFAIAASSGMIMNGHASAIGQQQAHLTAMQSSMLVGIFAMANFVGRLGSGILSDRINRYRLMAVLLAINACALFLLHLGRDFFSFMVLLCMVGISFGGVMTIIPALCGDHFGAKYFGSNYAVLFSGYTAAGFIGPLAASQSVQATGSYQTAFMTVGLLSLLGIVLIMVMHKKWGVAGSHSISQIQVKGQEECI